MVVRMPWGGLRRAGPYHSQNTEAWFYRTAGLKIVVPSTPHDARALMASAVADPDPVLYYEHIALYRDPRIKQAMTDIRTVSYLLHPPFLDDGGLLSALRWYAAGFAPSARQVPANPKTSVSTTASPRIAASGIGKKTHSLRIGPVTSA